MSQQQLSIDAGLVKGADSQTNIRASCLGFSFSAARSSLSLP